MVGGQVKLYDYTTGALVELTPEFMAEAADEYVMAHFIPQVPSAFALYAALRAEQEIHRSSDDDPDYRRDRIIMTVRLVALTALPGEVK